MATIVAEMKKIAILRRNGLGDLLCAYPLLLYLHQKFPDTKLTLFVDERNAPLIPFLPDLAEVVVIPKKGNKYWNLFRLAHRYRGEFDLAISAKTSPMKLANFFLFCLGAKKRVAYVDAKWHRILINAPIPFDPIQSTKRHQALKGLQTVAPELKEIPEELYPQLHIPEELKEKYSFNFEGKVLLISASTTREASRFDVDRYANLVHRLYNQHPFHVVIVGQKQDTARAEALAQRIRTPYSVHFPRSFEEFMVLLDASDLYFVGDGGIAHIGAALGKQVVTLFGETNPVEWRPLSRNVITFYHSEHVDLLSDEEIFQALRKCLQNHFPKEVSCGRDN